MPDLFPDTHWRMAAQTAEAVQCPEEASQAATPQKVKSQRQNCFNASRDPSFS